MNELLVLCAIGIVATSGLGALPFGTRSVTGDRIFAAWFGAGAGLGAVAAGRALAGVPATPISLPWQVPGGELAIALDALSAVFLLQICLVGSLGTVFGLAYWSAREHPESAAQLRVFYGLLVAGIALLLVAKNAVLFLVGWEIMALAAFFAITTDDTDAEVRASGYVYLVATRVGSLFLIATFAVLRSLTGSFSLAITGLSGDTAAGTAIFACGLVGFGMKAGMMPLHVWLPGAHANAPSHVSALMSGVLIKMGIYGLFRITGWFSTVPLAWGLALFALGALSAVLGVAFALGQHDLKRLLAYHSVENIGIIGMGLGIALIGRSLQQPTLVALGFAGSLLHVFNHGLFKSLLFFAAGATIRATHTREIDRLGGLIRQMPRTAVAFLVGAVAISGLPPLNGFVSELFLYLAMFRSQTLDLGAAGLFVALGAPVLALVGALAVACFAKVFGIVFLGLPRAPQPANLRDAPPAMLAPMVVLGLACVAIGVVPSWVGPLLERSLAAWTGEPTSLVGLAPLSTLSWLNALLLASLLVFGFALVSATARKADRQPTWDCGYAAPTPRMQYTASSFADGLVELFSHVLRPERHTALIDGPFPRPSSFSSHVPDLVLDRILTPVAARLARGATWFRWIQRGTVHLYLLYLLVTLILMFVVWR
ncbi:MAG: oxidoreductase [Polyangiaceae bacterium]|nr:oxidoreductase [Polyangiaceae bacterium]